jgi:predicted amidophosphoribosyltransferase
MPELLSCIVCGHDVASDAESCPNCGTECFFSCSVCGESTNYSPNCWDHTIEVCNKRGCWKQWMEMYRKDCIILNNGAYGCPYCGKQLDL